jgi:hypothetical protein
MAAAAPQSEPLVTWGQRESGSHDVEPFVTRHRFQETGLFTDEALAALIDRYPRDRLQVFTMGTDPTNNSDWAPVDTTGVSGAEMLRAAAVGRFWIKLMRLDLVDRELSELVNRAHEGIWSNAPGMLPGRLRPLLLISSPGALVYYHADAYPTMLWHVRGSKRVWIYPACKPDLVDPRLMEQIYAGEIDEEIPYQPSFDQQAHVFDLLPGQLLTWPLNAPHRIVNHNSVNVSVSVQYATRRGDQRSLVYHANHYFRKKLGLPMRSTVEGGLGAALKCTAFRVVRKLHIAMSAVPKRRYMARYRIDGSATSGMTLLPDGPVKTPF